MHARMIITGRCIARCSAVQYKRYKRYKRYSAVQCRAVPCSTCEPPLCCTRPASRTPRAAVVPQLQLVPEGWHRLDAAPGALDVDLAAVGHQLHEHNPNLQGERRLGAGGGVGVRLCERGEDGRALPYKAHIAITTSTPKQTPPTPGSAGSHRGPPTHLSQDVRVPGHLLALQHPPRRRLHARHRGVALPRDAVLSRQPLQPLLKVALLQAGKGREAGRGRPWEG